MADRITSIVPLGTAIQRDLQKVIRTVVPATVISYDIAGAYAGTATVMPAPMERDPSGEYLPNTPVQHVPVAFPSGNGFSISWALVPGNSVLLLVADRPTELWRATGQPYEPQSGIMHSLSYAFVWPGTGPAPDPITGLSATDFHIRGPAGLAFTITPAGQIVLGVNQSAAYAARVGDPVSAATAFATWIGQVTTAVNGLAPGAVTPFAGNIGAIASGSTAVRVT